MAKCRIDHAKCDVPGHLQRARLCFQRIGNRAKTFPRAYDFLLLAKTLAASWLIRVPDLVSPNRRHKSVIRLASSYSCSKWPYCQYERHFQ